MCLVGVERHSHKWRFVVNELCANYNHFHAAKMKCASFETSKSRYRFLMEFFGYVCPKFRIDPRDLKSKHVQDYFSWKIHELASEGCGEENIKLRIKNLRSFLSFFCRWIAKPGVVPSYQDLIARSGYRPKELKMPSSRANALSIDKVEQSIVRAFQIDVRLGFQLSFMAFFGLRPKESVGLVLSKCVVLGGDLAYPYIKIQTASGSKGGRPRRIEASNPSQVKFINVMMSLAEEMNIDALCWPDMTIHRAAARQQRLMSKELELSKDSFDGSAYQFRHSFANSFSALIPSGEPLRDLSENLGHAREEIAAAYLGSSGRAGEDSIPELARALAHCEFEPESFMIRLCRLIIEISFTDLRLALSLALWVLKTRDDEIYCPIQLLKNRLIGEKKSLLSPEEILDQLSEHSEKSKVREFMMRAQGFLNLDTVEQRVLTPLTNRIFFG
ncbi:integrase domain-containing protein [uncultured Parasutterella sp.]|uniref:integrase domain-containing protein n=1 Tax=uncultured Parasutterella sp. TaxID=1263098 RepID=UPI0025B7107E|nr:integrase domain-containing protein [uncultured Parasutterella sp.]